MHFKAKSGQILVLLKIFLNTGLFRQYKPNLTIFSIPVNNDTVNMSQHFGCQGNHLGGDLCITIDTKLLNY